MTRKKTARNARIVRLRNWKRWSGRETMTWTHIARVVANEFPKDKCSWQRCQAIYKRDTTGVLLNDGAKFYRDRK